MDCFYCQRTATHEVKTDWTGQLPLCPDHSVWQKWGTATELKKEEVA